MRPERPARHSWVRLDDRATDLVVAPQHQDQVDRWIALGLPLVVASAVTGDGPHRLRLGLALPDKTRITVGAALDDILDILAPPPLELAITQAPLAWRERLDALAAALPRRCAVYGSLAWQMRSNQPYVRPDASDLDLTIAVGDDADADAVCAMLVTLDGDAIPRLDGELCFGQGSVPWREWASGADAVLVKRHGPATILPRDQWRSLR